MDMNNHGQDVLLTLRNEFRLSISITLGYCTNHQYCNGIVVYIYVHIVFIFKFSGKIKVVLLQNLA